MQNENSFFFMEGVHKEVSRFVWSKEQQLLV